MKADRVFIDNQRHALSRVNVILSEQQKNTAFCRRLQVSVAVQDCIYEGWNFNSGNYLFTTDTK